MEAKSKILPMEIDLLRLQNLLNNTNTETDAITKQQNLSVLSHLKMHHLKVIMEHMTKINLELDHHANQTKINFENQQHIW